MKVYYRSFLADTELTPGSVFRTTPCKAYLEVVTEKNEASFEAVYNGSISVPGTLLFECNVEAELVIRQSGEKHSYTVKPLVSVMSNKYSLAYEQFAFEHMEMSGNEVDSIRNGKLKMYAVDQSTEVHDWTEVFDLIESSFPAFKSICEKPKSHLRAVNEVRPIETVKRIGYESIPYLAAHSEDWLARTASGLKPARLFSRVEDDEYQIYENRVTKTLIDLIIAFLRKRESELKYQYEQLHGIINSSVQTGSFGFDVGFQKAVSELLCSGNSDSEHRIKSLEFVDKLRERAALLLKKYRSLRASRMYRYLKKAKLVTNPLNETNILLMDRHYNTVYYLWKRMHKELAPLDVEDDNAVVFRDAYSDYLRFCKTLCAYTAHVLGFDVNEDGKYFRKNDNLELEIIEKDNSIRVVFRDKTNRYADIPSSVLLPITAGSSFESFSYDGTKLFWANNVSADDIERFCSMFKTHASRGREQAEEKKKYNAIKKLINDRQQEYQMPQQHETIIWPAIVELESGTRSAFREWVDEWAENIVCNSNADYLIVALPRCEENEQRVVSYAKSADKRILLLPLTLFDINSYRRLQNLFIRQITQFHLGKCPCCGGNMRENSNQLICDNCNQLVLTTTICPNTECKKSYTYLSYNVSKETLDKMKAVNEDSFFQYDSLFQYKDIVDMSIHSEKLRTVCPYCGKTDK